MEAIEKVMNDLMVAMQVKNDEAISLHKEIHTLNVATVEALKKASLVFFSGCVYASDRFEVELNSIEVRRADSNNWWSTVAKLYFTENWKRMDDDKPYYKDVAFTCSSLNTDKLQEVTFAITAGQMAHVYFESKEQILEAWNGVINRESERRNLLHHMCAVAENEVRELSREYARQKENNLFYEARENGLKLNKVSWVIAEHKRCYDIIGIKTNVSASGKSCFVKITYIGQTYDYETQVHGEREVTYHETVSTEKMKKFLNGLKDEDFVTE